MGPVIWAADFSDGLFALGKAIAGPRGEWHIHGHKLVPVRASGHHHMDRAEFRGELEFQCVHCKQRALTRVHLPDADAYAGRTEGVYDLVHRGLREQITARPWCSQAALPKPKILDEGALIQAVWDPC